MSHKHSHAPHAPAATFIATPAATTARSANGGEAEQDLAGLLPEIEAAALAGDQTAMATLLTIKTALSNYAVQKNAAPNTTMTPPPAGVTITGAVAATDSTLAGGGAVTTTPNATPLTVAVSGQAPDGSQNAMAVSTVVPPPAELATPPQPPSIVDQLQQRAGAAALTGALAARR